VRHKALVEVNPKIQFAIYLNEISVRTYDLRMLQRISVHMRSLVRLYHTAWDTGRCA
jgi:hypothetical protein